MADYAKKKCEVCSCTARLNNSGYKSPQLSVIYQLNIRVHDNSLISGFTSQTYLTMGVGNSEKCDSLLEKTENICCCYNKTNRTITNQRRYWAISLAADTVNISQGPVPAKCVEIGNLAYVCPLCSSYDEC